MTNCEICDQELVDGDFEEKLGICVTCLMLDSRDDSYTSFFNVLLLFLGLILFISALFPVLFIIGSLFVNDESNIIYLIPPLIVCVILGPGLIYFSAFYNRT